MRRETSSGGLAGDHLGSEEAQQAPGDVALRLEHAWMLRQVPGQRRGDKDDQGVDGDTDDDLRAAELKELPPRRSQGRIDELRDQGGVQERDLGVQEIREQPHAKQPGRGMRVQLAGLERRHTAGPKDLPGQPGEVGRTQELHGVVGLGLGREQRGQAGSSGYQLGDETESYSGE